MEKSQTSEVAVGTNNLVAVVDLLIDTVGVVQKALADGKISLADAALLFELVPDLSPAFSGAGDALKELKDLTADEAAPIVAHVMTKLTVESAKAQAIVEASLQIGVAVLKLIKAL